MNNKLIPIGSATILALTAYGAWAEGPWYAAVQAGATFLNDADNTGRITLTSDHDAGFGVMGSIGRAFGNGIRMEGEIGYRQNAIDDFTIPNDDGLGNLRLGDGVPNLADVSPDLSSPATVY